jgi:hypothetical protein
VDASERDRLLRALQAAIGPDEAATLMEKLPPFDWSKLATKDDLAALEARMATKDDLAALEARMASKTELERLTTEVRTGMAHLEARISDSHASLVERIEGQNRTYLLYMVATVLSTVAALSGALAVLSRVL